MLARLLLGPEAQELMEPTIVLIHKARALPPVPLMNFVMKEVENVDEMNPLEREELAQASQSLGSP